jgi:hypothetical protein
MPDHPELPWPELEESVASIDATLKDEHSVAIAIAESLDKIGGELNVIRRMAFPPKHAAEPLAAPIPPGTAAQGYLSSRWNRRNGTVYGVTLTGDEHAVKENPRRRKQSRIGPVA